MSTGLESIGGANGLVGRRLIHNEAVLLRRAVMTLSVGRDYRIEAVADFTVRITPFVKAGFMVSRKVYEGAPADRQTWIVSDERASERLLDGVSPKEIRKERAGRMVATGLLAEEVEIGLIGPFASDLARYGKEVSPLYVSIAVDAPGVVAIQDVSPLGTEVYADFAGAFADQCDAFGDMTDAPNAKVLAFPSKSIG